LSCFHILFSQVLFCIFQYLWKKKTTQACFPYGIPQLQFEFKRSSIELLLALLFEIMPKAIRVNLKEVDESTLRCLEQKWHNMKVHFKGIIHCVSQKKDTLNFMGCVARCHKIFVIRTWTILGQLIIILCLKDKYLNYYFQGIYIFSKALQIDVHFKIWSSTSFQIVSNLYQYQHTILSLSCLFTKRHNRKVYWVHIDLFLA
jgi:hypothetical protein